MVGASFLFTLHRLTMPSEELQIFFQNNKGLKFGGLLAEQSEHS